MVDMASYTSPFFPLLPYFALDLIVSLCHIQ